MSSIYEVAKRAGVSITTVSHVYSGNRPVTKRTADRVLAAAAELRYVPTATARGLATGRSMILGVAFPGMSDFSAQQGNPFFHDMLERISQAAAASGCAILLVPPRAADGDDAMSQQLLDRVDGVILIDPSTADDLGKVIVDRGTPAIAIGRVLNADGVAYVEVPIGEAIGEMLDHANRQGYRRPALLVMEDEHSYTRDIRDAFECGTRLRGMAGVVETLRENFDGSFSGFVERLLLSPDRPDFIFAGTDLWGSIVIRVATSIGLAVPAELGVVGAGNTILCDTSIPALSSVDVRSGNAAQAAVGALLAIIDGEPAGASVLPPALFVPRASSTRLSSPNSLFDDAALQKRALSKLKSGLR